MIKEGEEKRQGLPCLTWRKGKEGRQEGREEGRRAGREGKEGREGRKEGFCNTKHLNTTKHLSNLPFSPHKLTSSVTY